MSHDGAFVLEPEADTRLVGTRRFDAPRELVFRAWTEPALLMRWMDTPRMPMSRAELELRAGGRMRYEWRGADGSQIGLSGAVAEVDAPRRLVHLEVFDEDWTGGEVEVTTTFDARGDQTAVTMTMRYRSREARDAVQRSPMAEGMAICFDKLERLLPTIRASVTPFLAFASGAEEALALYTAVFEDARVLRESRAPDGALFIATIELQGQRLTLMNGGPGFQFSTGISLCVSCETQAEVDAYWARLGEGGEHGRCGWLQDRFGVSWQIVPRALPRLLESPEAGVSRRVMGAMLTMQKLDVATLEAAARGA